jgi:hypothetical protein
VAMLRPGLDAVDQHTHASRAGDPDRTPHATWRHPFHQQAFEERTLVLHTVVVLAGLGTLTPAGVTVTVLCAIRTR